MLECNSQFGFGVSLRAPKRFRKYIIFPSKPQTPSALTAFGDISIGDSGIGVKGRRVIWQAATAAADGKGYTMAG